MNNFILVDDNGGTYKCEPKLIRSISQAEMTKLATATNVTGRVKRDVLELSPSRFTSMVHFQAALPSEAPHTKLPLYTMFENGKKIIFSKLNQIYFSGPFRESGESSELATFSSYSSARDGAVLYSCTLPWSTSALQAKTGLRVYFIPFASFSSKGRYLDKGRDLSQIDWATRSETNAPGLTHSTVRSLFEYEQAQDTGITLNLAMGIEGYPDAFFPLVSNVFEDLKVCLGRYYPQNGRVTAYSDEQMFSFMLTSFLFSEFNSDLAGVNGGQRETSQDFRKTDLLQRMFSWDKNTLRYSPSITKDEILGFANQNIVRKFALDVSKKVLDVMGY